MGRPGAAADRRPPAGEERGRRSEAVAGDRRDRRPASDAARSNRSWEGSARPRRRDESAARPEWRERRPQADRSAPDPTGERTGWRGRPGSGGARPQQRGGPADRAGGRSWRDRRPTDDRRPRPDRDRTPPVAPGPDLPDWADARELDPAIRASLRGLDSRNAEKVARHLVVAGTLVDDDPELALSHARAARDRASRIAVVREAVGVAAYHAGDYAEASRELRAYRRMSGDEGYRAVLADCERALGRPEVALRLVREALADQPDPAETVELRLVEAGARQDLGEAAAARLVLEGALGGRPVPTGVDLADEGTRRIASAYADLLAAGGDPAAGAWREAVDAAAPDEDEDVAFGEEELPLPEAGTADETATGAAERPEDSAADTGHDTGEGDTGADGEDTVPADVEDVEDVEDVDFDADVEREVAELLGEVDPPAEDEPGH
ncbi:hypothetical protein ACI780_17275 [Geodermatophilus sp. SYSU D00814]